MDLASNIHAGVILTGQYGGWTMWKAIRGHFGLLVYGLALLPGACEPNHQPEATLHVKHLIMILNGDSYVGKLGAFQELQEMRESAKPAVPTLIKILEGDKAVIPGAADAVKGQLINRQEEANPDIRARAAYTLGAIGPEAKEAVPTLVAKLKDTHASVRSASAKALAGIGWKDGKVLAALSERLEDPNWVVRIDTALALDSLYPEDERAVSTLVDLLKAKNAGRRRVAAVALGRCRSIYKKAAIPALVVALRDPDEEVRSCVAGSLGWICEVEEMVVPALVDRLHDKSASVRLSVAQTLGYLGPKAKSAVPALTRALKEDPDEDVRLQVAQSLKGIEARAKE